MRLGMLLLRRHDECSAASKSDGRDTRRRVTTEGIAFGVMDDSLRPAAQGRRHANNWMVDGYSGDTFLEYEVPLPIPDKPLYTSAPSCKLVLLGLFAT